MNIVFSSTKSLILCGIAGATLFGINFIPAQLLTGLGAGAAVGAIWGGLTAPFIMASVALITGRIGAITITYMVYSVFAIPTFVMGPPHPYKPLLALLAGISYDLAMTLVGGVRPRGLFVGFTVFTAVSLFIYLEAFRILNLPGLEKLQASIYYFGIAFLALGYLGTTIALGVYKKLKDNPFIRSYKQTTEVTGTKDE